MQNVKNNKNLFCFKYEKKNTKKDYFNYMKITLQNLNLKKKLYKQCYKKIKKELQISRVNIKRICHMIKRNV